MICFIYPMEKCHQILCSNLSAECFQRNLSSMLSRFLRTTHLNFDRTCFRRCYISNLRKCCYICTISYFDILPRSRSQELHMEHHDQLYFSFFFSQGVPREKEVDFIEQFVPYLTRKVKYVLSCRSTILKVLS